MLEATIELFGGLFLAALSLAITFSIAGSIVAALRAVNEKGFSHDERPRPLTTATHHQNKLPGNETETSSEVFRSDTRG
jgi:hypothetical protein